MILNTTLLTNFALAATYKSRWIDARSCAFLQLQWSNDAGSSPVYALTVEESDDPVCATELYANPADSSATAAKSVVTSGDTTRVSVVGSGLTVSGANNTLINMVSPGRYVRLVATKTSGSATASLFVTGRP